MQAKWALPLVLALVGHPSQAPGQPVLVIYPSEGAELPAEVARPSLAGLSVSDRSGDSALAHWLALREGDDAAFALESIQFAAWRVQARGYRVLAVTGRTIAYSVVTRRGVSLVDVEDLAGLRIAVPPPPSLPALQLLALFGDPLRAPRIAAVADFEQGLAALRAGRVDAAVLPETLSRRVSDVHEVLTLEEVPVAVLTAAPEVETATARRVRAQLAGPSSVNPHGEATPGGLIEAEDDPARRVSLLGGTWGASR